MKQTETAPTYTPQIQDFPSIEILKFSDTNIHKYAKMQTSNYVDLSYKIRNILEVCRVALLNETDKIDGFQVAEVLQVARDIIPHEEFELLDNLHTQAIQNLKAV